MTRREYYSRLMSTAAKNTVLRTGSIAFFMYAILTFVIGSAAYYLYAGPESLWEKWEVWLVFTLVGGLGAWAVAMFLMMIAAPWQMYKEDQAAFDEQLSEERNRFESERQQRDTLARLESERLSNAKGAIRKLATLIPAGELILQPSIIAGPTWQVSTKAGLRGIVRPHIYKGLFSRIRG